MHVFSPILSTCLTHLIVLNHHLSNSCWGVQVLKFLTVEFSLVSYYLIHLRSQYLPQHPVL